MNELQELQTEHFRGRAKNAVQNFLVRQLLVPKVYLDANWDGWNLDVLAIDRAGVGDVHGVQLVPWEAGRGDNHGYSRFLEDAVSAALQDFSDFPGHFRYLAVVCAEPDKPRWRPSRGIVDLALAPDGVGRTGLLFVNVAEVDPELEILIKPERFRSTPQIVDMADRFVAEHTANWEVRD